jgi:small-conductance mechanosensitive channel
MTPDDNGELRQMMHKAYAEALGRRHAELQVSRVPYRSAAVLFTFIISMICLGYLGEPVWSMVVFGGVISLIVSWAWGK